MADCAWAGYYGLAARSPAAAVGERRSAGLGVKYLSQAPDTYTEGLKILRFMMVLSSISPLFTLWAIRGTTLIPDAYFISGCLLLATVPTLTLILREVVAKRRNDTRSMLPGQVEDHRAHILAYLFAMLLPFYRQDVESWRDFGALLAALIFIIFLFWHLRLHYMNIIFALRRYHILTIYPPETTNPYADRNGYILITRNRGFAPNDRIVAYRLTNGLYMEKD